MLQKPLRIGLIALVVVLLIVAGVLLVPRLMGQPPASPDAEATPAATGTVVDGQAATAAPPSDDEATAASGEALATETPAAVETATPDSEALPSATPRRTAPGSDGPQTSTFPGDPPGQDASLRKLGNLREGPGTETRIIAVLDAGTRVRITQLNPSRQWARVITLLGEVGWVYYGNLEIEP